MRLRYIVAFRLEGSALQCVTFRSEETAVAVAGFLREECCAVDAWIVRLDVDLPDGLVLSAGLVLAEMEVVS